VKRTRVARKVGGRIPRLLRGYLTPISGRRSRSSRNDGPHSPTRPTNTNARAVVPDPRLSGPLSRSILRPSTGPAPTRPRKHRRGAAEHAPTKRSRNVDNELWAYAHASFCPISLLPFPSSGHRCGSASRHNEPSPGTLLPLLFPRCPRQCPGSPGARKKGMSGGGGRRCQWEGRRTRPSDKLYRGKVKALGRAVWCAAG
jgi:hypothetical protein